MCFRSCAPNTTVSLYYNSVTYILQETIKKTYRFLVDKLYVVVLALAVAAPATTERILFMNYDDFRNLPKNVRDIVIQQTFLNANGKATKHAIQNIIVEEREKSIAARMWNGVKKITKFEFQNKNIFPVGSEKLSGRNIADIYIESVKKNGFAWYPMTGTSWIDAGVKQIILFIKENEKYIPYAALLLKRL